MTSEDCLRFVQEGVGEEIPVAQLSQSLTLYLGATSRTIYLRHDYALKAIRQHRMALTQFSMIERAVTFGRALADRDAHITFLYFDQGGWNRWFKTVVKRAFESRRLYIATFYKTDLLEVVRKTKRHPLLRE